MEKHVNENRIDVKTKHYSIKNIPRKDIKRLTSCNWDMQKAYQISGLRI